MADQDSSRIGAPTTPKQNGIDTVSAAMDTLALTGSVVPFTGNDSEFAEAADTDMLSDIGEIARGSAIAGLDAAISALQGAPHRDPMADECLNDIAHVVAMMVDDLESCVADETDELEPAVAASEKVLEPAL
jgi:hypothetical protein